MRRRQTVIIAALVYTLSVGTAAAQSDPRAEGQAAWAAAFNSNISGDVTAWGYVADLLSYAGSGSGCTSNVYRYQRSVYRGNRHTREESLNFPIDWKQVSSVESATITSERNNPNGIVIKFKSGQQQFYGFMSRERADNALRAGELLIGDCQRVFPAIPELGAYGWTELPARLTAEFARALPSLTYLHDYTRTRQPMTHARVEGCWLHTSSYSGLMLSRLQPYAGGARITFLNPDGSRAEIEGPADFIAYAARGLYALKGNCPS